MTTINDLPSELLKQILTDFETTEEDRKPNKSLLACTLVSRDWNEIANEVLFACLFVNSQAQAENLLSGTKLDSVSCRELTIQGTWPAEEEGALNDNYPMSVEPASVAAILEVVHGTQEISLFGGYRLDADLLASSELQGELRVQKLLELRIDD